MEYQRNLKYYKSNDKHFYVGVIILGVGVLLFALGNFLRLRFLPSQTPISMIIMGIGAVVAFVPSSGRSGEADIDEAVLSMTRDYGKETEESVRITLSRRINPAVIGDYVYDGEDILVRRGRTDRKYRTSKYAVSALLFTKDGIYIAQKTFSLIEDSVTETEMEFIFEDMESICAECEERVFDEKNKTKIWFLVIKENGKEPARLPVKYNATVDKLCDDVSNAMAEAKAAKKS